MPILDPNHPSLTPAWQLFRCQILARAKLRCECTGQCGLHTSNKIARRCLERHGRPAIFARGRVILTIAHVCACTPPCMDPQHVRAMCQRCHLRTDRQLHLTTRRARQDARLALADWT